MSIEFFKKNPDKVNPSEEDLSYEELQQVGKYSAPNDLTENINTKAENELDIESSGLGKLNEHLKVTLGSTPENKRLEAWIESQIKNNKLQEFPAGSSAIKTPFTVQNWEDVIIKRFDKGNNEDHYNEEKEWFSIVSEYLGKNHLPTNEFVEIHNTSNKLNKHFVLQDKVTGVHQEAVADEAINIVNDKMTEEEIIDKYVKKPKDWVEFRGEILRKKFTDEQWEKVKIQAEDLFTKLKELENKYVINDLDFFVTEEGEIKIIDFQLHQIDSYTPDPERRPIGSEEIKILFGAEE
ncbi:hypothetical protein ACFLY7_02355 [Patescibacteria group bacterium]